MNIENSGLKKLRELGYDAIADEIAKSLEKWDDGLKMCGRSLIKNYLDGQYGIHLHILAWDARTCTPLDPYCVQYKIELLSVLKIGVGDIQEVVRRDSDPPYSILPGHRSAHCKRAVLVDPIQIVDLREGIPVPSIIRLQRLDNRAGGGTDASDLPRGLIRVFPSILKDGEFGGSDLLLGHCWGVGLREGKREMIERRPQIEKTVSDNEAQLFGDGADMRDSEAAWLASAADKLRRGLWVRLINDSVGFGLDPSTGLLLKTVEVFACPLKF